MMAVALVNLPNLISFGRLVLAPIAIWLIVVDSSVGALWLIVLAGVSDAVDGILARWLSARTLLGSYLDPIADKALLVGVYCALAYRDALPLWLVVMVVSRDIFIMGGALLLYMFRPAAAPVQPSGVSKLNTTIQIVLAILSVAMLAYGIGLPWLKEGLIWMVATTTILSGVGYAMRAGQRLGSIEARR